MMRTLPSAFLKADNLASFLAHSLTHSLMLEQPNWTEAHAGAGAFLFGDA